MAGDQPLFIGGASLADGMPGQSTVTGTRALTFDGAPSITMPPGAEIVTDPIADFAVEPGSYIAVSLFLRRQQHALARCVRSSSRGDPARVACRS